MKLLEEWYVNAPWGKIALVSWGDPKGDPVLLVHGRQDSVDTFKPLLEFLPDKYYYVGFDLPGSGKSDDFAKGVLVPRLLPVSAIHAVIQHLKWSKFVYIGHSMGAELGLFYNAIYPDMITKMILLDVAPGIMRLQISDVQLYFETFYKEYYSNYAKYNIDDRVYSEEQALNAVMNARGMTRAQAEVILARNLKRIGEDRYMLAWDKRQRIAAPTNLPPEYYGELFAARAPPSLYVNADTPSANYYVKGKEAAHVVLRHVRRHASDSFSVTARGGHDVHYTHPERIAKVVCEFLNRRFTSNNISKL